MTEEILKMYYDQIKEFDKLKIKEAKIKYIELTKEINPKEKNKKRQKIIQDTLYIPLNFINKNKNYFTIGTSYDINDIINTIYEIWIELIDEGILLSVNNYSEIFNLNSTFYTRLVDKLSLSRGILEETFILNTKNFSDILLKYLTLKEKQSEVTYNEYLSFIKQELNKDEEYFKYYVGYYYLYKTYLLLDSLSNKLKKIEISRLSKTKIDKLKYLLLEDILKENIEVIYIPDIEDNIINKDFNSNILKILLSNLNEKELELIKKRFGIDEYQIYSLDELSKVNKVTKERIRQIEAHILRKARRVAARNKIKY